MTIQEAQRNSKRTMPKRRQFLRLVKRQRQLRSERAGLEVARRAGEYVSRELEHIDSVLRTIERTIQILPADAKNPLAA